MNRGEKGSGKHFTIGLLIYAFLFLLLAAGGLAFFWHYLDCYEQSRSEYAVDEYMETLSREKLEKMAEPYAHRLDTNICPVDYACEYVVQQLYGKLSCSKNSAECTDDELHYWLKWDKQKIGSFTIVKSGEDKFGFPIWSEGDGELFYESMFQYGSIAVPQDLSVKCCDYVLNEGYVTNTAGRFELFSSLYGDYPFPNIYTYSYGPYVGECQVSVLNKDGQAVEYVPDEYLDNCTPEEKALLDEFTGQLVVLYAQYAGSSIDTFWSCYYRIKPLLVPDTNLYQRMRDAFGALKYSKVTNNSVSSMKVNNYYRMDDGRYFCDISYEVKSTSGALVRVSNSDAKMIIQCVDGNLLTEAFFNYSGD